jgi:lipopolysaccharide export LptBFGC system permease protein LptF
MLGRLTQRRAKNRRARELRETIGQFYVRESLGERGTPEFETAYRAIVERNSSAENELKTIRQMDLLVKIRNAGLLIPPEHLENPPWPLRQVLTEEGEAWARRELKKIRRSEIEFWSKIALPILSLILSIIALMWKR